MHVRGRYSKARIALGQFTAPAIPAACKNLPSGYLATALNTVSQYGCTPAGQAAAAAALAQIPGVGPALSVIGTPLLVSCACAQMPVQPVQGTMDTTAWTIAFVAIGAALYMAKQKRDAESLAFKRAVK